MRINFHRSILSIIFLIILAILPACDGGGGGGSVNSNQVSLELGEEVLAGSSSVGTGNTILTVESDGDPIDGLEIDIPPAAYQETTTFTVSHTPIISNSDKKKYIDPVTPLITIKNGGEYSDEIITVKIPVTIEDGYHYMAFYYDEATGAHEGIPELEHDDTSITIATRHFSSLYVNRVQWTLLLENFDSGFKVKQDNWQFENPGTYLSPGGICSGMSITSLYYYLEKKKKESYPPLFGFYDIGSATLGIDDDQALKLCSTVQWWEGNFNNLYYKRWYNLGAQKSDLWTFLMFAHAIAKTGEPQYVSIYTPDGQSGHALVVYKKSGNDLYVADPNLPNDSSVKIEFDLAEGQTFGEALLNGTFKSFESQWNKGTEKIDFTKVFYIGKSALIDSDFSTLWNHLDNGTVPWNTYEDQSLYKDYPGYALKIIEKDNTGTERESILTDGYKTTNSLVKVKVETYDFDPRINVFYDDTLTLLDNSSGIIEVNLQDGKNDLGFYIEAELYSDVTKEKAWAWTDFKYLTIEREEEDVQTEASISVTNTLDMNVTVLINNEYPGGGSNSYLEPGETLKQVYGPGAYLIEVKTAGVVSSGKQLEYTRQINLNPGQAYVYDFETTQDCNAAKLTIVNKSPYRVKLYKNGDYWTNFSLDPNTESSTYLRVGESYSLDAKAPTWEGLCYSDCVYTCWDGPTFTLDCQGYTWTISGSGTTCP